MVKLHAELAGLPAPRTTVDVDSALHLETRAITFAQAATRLQGAGYVLDTTTKHAYRFDRGPDRVDLMCSDRQSTWKRLRYDVRPLFGIPGGTRALQQTINIDALAEADTSPPRLCGQPADVPLGRATAQSGSRTPARSPSCASSRACGSTSFADRGASLRAIEIEKSAGRDLSPRTCVSDAPKWMKCAI